VPSAVFDALHAAIAGGTLDSGLPIRVLGCHRLLLGLWGRGVIVRGLRHVGVLLFEGGAAGKESPATSIQITGRKQDTATKERQARIGPLSHARARSCNFGRRYLGTAIAGGGNARSDEADMKTDELERALTQLDQAEACVFQLVESEPDLIRQPEIVAVLTHLKSAIDSLRTAGHRARQASRQGALGRGRED
jgi:hypothetical protein